MSVKRTPEQWWNRYVIDAEVSIMAQMDATMRQSAKELSVSHRRKALDHYITSLVEASQANR